MVVIDGDGSLLMNPGTLATAASVALRNLTIVAIDNGAYGSTGNQPTLAGSCVDLEQVAQGFGFRNTMKVAGEQELIEVMKDSAEGADVYSCSCGPGEQGCAEYPGASSGDQEAGAGVSKDVNG